MRKFIYLLVLLCLPLYGFAMQGSLPPVAGAASPVHQLEHQLEHDQGVQHHHHEEDGSVHYDESEESLDHAQDHSSTSQPAGVGFPRVTVPLEQSAREPGHYVPEAVPEPVLDGPHRPPASAPGHAAGGMLHA